MKFLFIALSALLITTKSKAAEYPSPEVLNSFYYSFAQNTPVAWSTFRDLYKADVTINNKRLSIFYNADGESVAVAQYILINDIPESLRSDLMKTVGADTIKETFEVSNTQGSNYYVTVENEKQTKILVAFGNKWKVFQKINKK
jgi:hypothetical protein